MGNQKQKQEQEEAIGLAIGEIKRLRVDIDYLFQIVKGFQNDTEFIIDTTNLTVEEVEALAEEIKAATGVFVGNFETPVVVPQNKSEELKDCYRSLRLAKAWLGKLLSFLDDPTPYTNDGKRKKVKDIEPAAEAASFDWKEWNELHKDQNYIQKIDGLRQHLDHLSNDRIYYIVGQIFKLEWPQDKLKSSILVLQKTECYLKEARFFLGFELQRIKENS